MQEGSLLEIIQRLTVWRTQALIVFLVLPVITFLLGWLLHQNSKKASGWCLAILTHIAVLPGICMSMVVVYLMFFSRENLLARYDAVLFFGPIICMVATLIAARKVQPFDEIPGLDRLSGLMLTAGAAFFIVFVFSRLRFGIFFFMGPWALLGVFLVLFITFKVGLRKIRGA